MLNIKSKYRKIRCPEHPTADKYGFVYEHVLVAEKKLGRLLKDGEVVHHIDENKSNNDPENLLIFASLSDHTAFHNSKSKLYYIDDEGVAHCTVTKNKFCLECGAEVYPGSLHCVKCSIILRRKRERKCERPDTETLKNLVRHESFESVGRMFGVSGKAITKWCKQIGIPYKRKDIKNMSDKEWEEIQ